MPNPLEQIAQPAGGVAKVRPHLPARSHPSNAHAGAFVAWLLSCPSTGKQSNSKVGPKLGQSHSFIGPPLSMRCDTNRTPETLNLRTGPNSKSAWRSRFHPMLVKRHPSTSWKDRTVGVMKPSLASVSKGFPLSCHPQTCLQTTRHVNNMASQRHGLDRELELGDGLSRAARMGFVS